MISVQNLDFQTDKSTTKPKRQLLPFWQKASSGHPLADLLRTCLKTLPTIQNKSTIYAYLNIDGYGAPLAGPHLVFRRILFCLF